MTMNLHLIFFLSISSIYCGVMGGRSISNINGSKAIAPLTFGAAGQHFAICYFVPSDDRLFHGASAILSVHEPQVKYQFSGAAIYIQNGQFPDYDRIQVGWRVDPALYDGDVHPRLTAGFSKGNGQNCLNMLCGEFVQVHSTIVLGSPIARSTRGRPYVMDIKVEQNSYTGDWWLTVDSETIGYWPQYLFARLTSGATFIGFGGETYGSPGEPTPSMGTGDFPSIQPRGSFFGNTKVANGSHEFVSTDNYRLDEYKDNVLCYDLRYIKSAFGYAPFLRYGGPGGTNCCVN